MIDYIGMLKEFHDKFNHSYSSKPTSYITHELYNLRKKLIQEESEELFDAMYACDLVEIADGLADLLYVVFGTALSYGIPIDEIFKEVHRSNMTKSMLKDEKSIKGKTIKGDNYDPPNLAPILNKYS